MIRRFLIGCLLLPVVSLAQQPVIINAKMLCNETKIVLAEIAKSEYREVPMWVGDISKESNLKLAIVANEKTKTWTIIQYNDEITCIMSVGEGYRFVKNQ